MNIQIRPPSVQLTKTQRARIERRLGLVLARYGDRIDRVIVRLSNANGGLMRCQLEVRVKPQRVTAEHADLDLFQALEHAAGRAARSVGRTVENQVGPGLR